MKPEKKSIKLEDFWENDPEIKKVRIANEGIIKLRDALTVSKNPIIIMSYKAGIKVEIALTPTKPVFTILFSQHKEDLVTAAIEEALLKERCNSLSQEKIDLLSNFFSDLKIEVP